MDRQYESKYHALEQDHWWFCARRRLVRRLIHKLCPVRSARVLEIGCSSGVLLQELAGDDYTDVIGIDISAEAIEECHRRRLANARVMDAQQLDFPAEYFDAITASDVLEHLSDDAGALRDWHRVLRPGGVALIFVPAFMSLWSEHDVANHHYRRYRLRELREKAAGAGFVIERQSYWNAALFMPIALVRAVKRRLPRNGAAPGNSDLFPPPAPVNWMLLRTLAAENAVFARGMNFPFGVSAMVVARKRA